MKLVPPLPIDPPARSASGVPLWEELDRALARRDDATRRSHDRLDRALARRRREREAGDMWGGVTRHTQSG